MRSLIAKEWRESRALILGFLVLAPVASLLIKGLLVGFKHTEAADSLAFIIPGAFALFVFALSADLASGDISSGRISFFAALPMSPGKVWAAKSIFLAGAGILYLGYVLLIEVVILSIAGKDATPLVGAPAAGMTLPLAAIVTAGAATFLFSTLLDRGFAAALAGFGIVAGCGIALGSTIKAGPLGIKLEVAYLSACVLLTVALLAGSAAAFLAGRVHLRARLRRVIVAGLAFLLILVPATVWAGISVRNWVTIDADEENLYLGGGRPTPDGKWALVSANRRGDGPFGAGSVHEDWAVNLETGVVREFGKTGWVTGGDEAFSEGPGRIVLHRPQENAEGKNRWLRVVYDLNEGRPLSTRSTEQPRVNWRDMPWGHHRMDMTTAPRRLLTKDGRSINCPKGWWFSSATAPWGVALYRRGNQKGLKYRLLSLDDGRIREISHFPHLLPVDPTGSVLCIGQPMRRIPLDGGEPEEVDIGKVNSHAASPDRRYAVVSSSQGLYLLSAADASVRKIEDETPCRRGPSIRWTEDSKKFLIHGRGPSLKGTVRDGIATVEPVQVTPLITYPVHFDGARLLGFGQHQSAYFISDLSGSSRRLLPTR